MNVRDVAAAKAYAILVNVSIVNSWIRSSPVFFRPMPRECWHLFTRGKKNTSLTFLTFSNIYQELLSYEV